MAVVRRGEGNGLSVTFQHVTDNEISLAWRSGLVGLRVLNDLLFAIRLF